MGGLAAGVVGLAGHGDVALDPLLADGRVQLADVGEPALRAPRASRSGGRGASRYQGSICSQVFSTASGGEPAAGERFGHVRRSVVSVRRGRPLPSDRRSVGLRPTPRRARRRRRARPTSRPSADGEHDGRRGDRLGVAPRPFASPRAPTVWNRASTAVVPSTTSPSPVTKTITKTRADRVAGQRQDDRRRTATATIRCQSRMTGSGAVTAGVGSLAGSTVETARRLTGGSSDHDNTPRGGRRQFARPAGRRPGVARSPRAHRTTGHPESPEHGQRHPPRPRTGSPSAPGTSAPAPTRSARPPARRSSTAASSRRTGNSASTPSSSTTTTSSPPTSTGRPRSRGSPRSRTSSTARGCSSSSSPPGSGKTPAPSTARSPPTAPPTAATPSTAPSAPSTSPARSAARITSSGSPARGPTSARPRTPRRPSAGSSTP